MKLKLEQEEMIEDFFDLTILLGITAPIDSYRFCWLINNEIGTNFRLNNNCEIQLKKKKRDYFFKVYQWQESETIIEHYLYTNQFDGEYLLPEFRNMDFLWLMKGDVVELEKINSIKNSIRSISGVQLVVEMTNEKIINKSNLIF